MIHDQEVTHETKTAEYVTICSVCRQSMAPDSIRGSLFERHTH